jgi:hypothetical protein
VRADIVGQDGGTSLDRLERGPAVALKEFIGLRLEAGIVEALVVKMSVPAVNHGAVNSKWLIPLDGWVTLPSPPSGNADFAPRLDARKARRPRKRPKASENVLKQTSFSC